MKLENLHSPGIWFTCLPTDITTFYLGGGKKVKLDTIFGKTVTILVCFPFQTPENEGMSSRHSDQIFVTDRSCTDILTLIILIGLIIGFVRFLFIYYLYMSVYVCILYSLLFLLNFHTIETHDTIPVENAHNVFLLHRVSCWASLFRKETFIAL